jgi:hypothetical protein
MSGSSSRTRSGGAEPPAHAGRHRNVPLVIFGVLLVVGCALVFAVTSLNTGGRRQVLAVSRAVPIGHVVTGGDLIVVRVAAPPSVHLIAGAERSSVIGRPAAVPLVAGSLLTREALGAAAVPPAGQAVIGVALKAGRYPPGVASGVRVEAYAVPGESAAGAVQQSAAQAALPISEATVLSAQQGQDGGDVVVELQLPNDAVPAVTAAAATGTVALAAVAPRG